MKNQILLLFALCSAFTGYSQEQAFSNVSISNIHNQRAISFSLPSEVNVRYYRIEAGDDTTHFEVIATIKSKGNAVLARTYNYSLAGHTYKYYRVGMVGMNAGLTYSGIVPENKEPLEQEFKMKTEQENPHAHVMANK